MSESAEAKLAVLQSRVDMQDKRFDKIEAKLDKVLDQLAQITGGRKALWGLWSVVGLAITGVAGFFIKTVFFR